MNVLFDVLFESTDGAGELVREVELEVELMEARVDRFDAGGASEVEISGRSESLPQIGITQRRNRVY